MTYAKGDGVIYVGGWAVGGATVETMASSVGRMSHVDVLVVMGGTNDVRRGIPFDAAASSYKAIVSKVRPTSVLIADIPPYDGDPQAAARFSEELRRYASVQGWDFSDPWVFARDEDRYKQGASLDGTHPTISGYRKLGYELRIAILRVASYTVSG